MKYLSSAIAILAALSTVSPSTASLSTLLRNTLSILKCESSTSAPTPLNIIITPSPTPVNIWDQVGSDMNGGVGNEIGNTVGMNLDGNQLIVTGKTFVKYYTSDVNSYNIRAWRVQQDLSDTVVGNVITCAMSNQATQLVVGDPENVNGKAIVYTMTGNEWVLVSAFQGVAATDEFGYSVGITESGKRICVGAPGSNYVKIYDFLDDGIFWTLVLDDFSNGFGRSLALSGDGLRLGVGAYDSVGAVGSAFFYEMQEYYVIQRFDGDITARSAGYSFGHSIAFNTAGNVAAIGSLEEDYVKLVRFNEERKQFDDIGPPIIGEVDSGLGTSVSLSQDGSRLVVGVPFEDTGTDPAAPVLTGKAYVYLIGEASWVIIGGFKGEGATDEFGHSVGISGLGDNISVSGPKNDGGGVDAGAIKVYTAVDS